MTATASAATSGPTIQITVIVCAALILVALSAIGRYVRRTWHEQRELPARLVRVEDLAKATNSLAESTNARAEQLERRGNGHLADVVHAIDTKLDAHHKAIDARLGKVEAGLDESRRLAGQAATIAARNDQHYSALRHDLDDLRTRIWDHVRKSEDRAAEAEARNYFHEGALRELGVNVDEWREGLPGEDMP